MQPFQVELEGLTWRGWHRPGPGPRCLAVHGWLDNAGSFSRLVPHLPEWDFLSLDLPGHGLSDPLPAGPILYPFIDAVHNLCSMLEHWGDPPLILLGHSLGGGLATMAAAACPEQVRLLLLLDALGPLTSPAEEALQIFQRSRQSTSRPHRRRHYASLEEALERLTSRGHSREGALALAQRGIMRDAQGFYFHFDPRLKAISRLRITEEQIQPFLREIRCPVHIQSYSQGILPRWEALPARLACLREHQLVEMEGSHHHHLEAPEGVAEALLEFVRSHER